MGWLTVFAYFLTSLVAFATFRYGRTAAETSSWKREYLWLGVAGFMFILGVNKQLDIQSLFTEIGRAIARSQGWYRERRAVQLFFVVIFGIAAVLVLIMVAYRFRGSLSQYGILLLGLGFLTTFIVIRAASFHHVDQVLKIRLMRVRVNWFLELCGNALVLFAAARNMLRNSRKGRTAILSQSEEKS